MISESWSTPAKMAEGVPYRWARRASVALPIPGKKERVSQSKAVSQIYTALSCYSVIKFTSSSLLVGCLNFLIAWASICLNPFTGDGKTLADFLQGVITTDLNTVTHT